MNRALLLVLAGTVWSVGTWAGSLKPESVSAWDHYVAAAHTKLLERTQKGATFLWVDESPARRQQVLDGHILVLQADGNGRIKAPSALIHHWIGAAFIPGAKGEDVLLVLRDYDKYKQYYRPAVITSSAISKSDSGDRFHILLVNQSVLLKTAVDTEYESAYSRLDDKHWYGETWSTRVQEIENYGSSDEHKLPVGEGGGYIWRLASETRLEERDGGVYIEVEAMALSRDIPGSLKLFVEPIVRRLSRSALADSLKQTSDAVGTTTVASSGGQLLRTRRTSAPGMALKNP